VVKVRSRRNVKEMKRKREGWRGIFGEFGVFCGFVHKTNILRAYLLFMIVLCGKYVFI
jgi:hypothetical protein